MSAETLKDSLKVLEEGQFNIDLFQLKDINSFLEILKEGLGEHIPSLNDSIKSASILSLIPSEIPLPGVEELTFSNIAFKKADNENPAQLFFTISWPGEWNLFIDYFQVGELEFDIAIIGNAVEGRITGTVKYKDYEMEANVNLPSAHLEIRLLHPASDTIQPSPFALLQGKDYNFPHPGIAPEPQGAELSQLYISAYPLTREFAMDFGIDNIPISEKLKLSFTTSLIYLNGDPVLEFWSQIEFKGVKNTPGFIIPIQAQYNAINKLMRFEGGIALSDYNLLDVIEIIANKMGSSIEFPSFHQGKENELSIGYLTLALEKVDQQYSFDFGIELKNLIHIRHGATTIFSLKELVVQIHYSKSTSGEKDFEAHIEGYLSLLGKRLVTKANKNETGWQFIAKTAENETLELFEWLSDILEAGTDLELPEGLQDFKLKNAEITFHTGTKAFSIKGESEGALDIPIINDEVHSLEFSFSRNELQETELYLSGKTTVSYGSRKSVDIDVNIIYEDGTWIFEGRNAIDQKVALGSLVESVFSKTSVGLPSVITGFKAEAIGIKYQTKDNIFHLSALVSPPDFPSKGNDTNLYLDFNYAGSRSALGVSGKMIITDPSTGEKHEFLVAFGKSGKAKTSKTFLASYQGAATFQKIVGLFSSGLAKSLPNWVTPEMDNATFLISKNSNGDSRVLFLLDGNIRFSLKNLDLVGKYFSDETINVELKMNISTGVLEKAEVEAINKLLGQVGSDVQIPAEGQGQGFNLKTNITGSSLIPQNTGFTFKKISEGPGSESESEGEKPKSKTQWIDTSKKYGPVFIKKIGVTLEEGKFKLLIDGGLSMGAFTFRLMDLAVRVPLSMPLDPLGIDFSLAGLELKYKTATASLSGAFLAQKVMYDGQMVNGYFGEAALVLNDKSFKAIGSFINIPDHPSFFLYVVATLPIGGPSYFYVNGFALGFGINSRLNIPEIDEVRDFVLVKTAFDEVQLSNEVPESNLKLIQKDISPEIGSYWVAIGLKVMHVKILQSFFLATVEFGNRVEINLLGLTKLVLPPPGNSIVKAELAVKAKYVPDTGLLSIEGRLTKNSYILSPKARLTGGFAFFAWFKGDHAGDFVLSMGGYHPKFNKPPHYPTVPRLGLNWQVTRNILIKGGEYYALTPNSFMAGGRLEATASVGPIDAWFIAEAHFFVNFSPFQYEANVTVAMGATFEVDLLLVTIRKTMSFSASLDLWGPPFAGRATVDLGVIDFVIEFGPEKKKVQPISWNKFQQQFLPPREQTLLIDVSNGFVKDVSQDKFANGLDWILNPSEMILSIESAIPVQNITMGDDKISSEAAIGIAPMDLTTDKYKSEVQIEVYKGNDAVTKTFSFSKTHYRNEPKALWGEFMDKNRDGKSTLIKNSLAGISIYPKANIPAISVEFKVKDLIYGKAVEDLLKTQEGSIPENKYAEQAPIETNIASPVKKYITALNELGLNLDEPGQFVFDDKDDQWMEANVKHKTTGSIA